MSVIDLTQITNPQPHKNVLLQQGKLPDLSGIKLKAENCLNEKVTVSLPTSTKPEHPEHPDKPSRPHFTQADSFQHQPDFSDTGLYDRFGHASPNQPPFGNHQHRPPHDCPGKPQPEVSLTFIKPLTLHPESFQLANGQSIPLDVDGSAWLVQPDDTIQKVQISELLKQLGLR